MHSKDAQQHSNDIVTWLLHRIVIKNLHIKLGGTGVHYDHIFSQKCYFNFILFSIEYCPGSVLENRTIN